MKAQILLGVVALSLEWCPGIGTQDDLNPTATASGSTSSSPTEATNDSTTVEQPTTATSIDVTVTQGTSMTSEVTSDPTASTADPTGDCGTCSKKPLDIRFCGDGSINNEEECDEGSQNGEDKPCTPLCKVASCGDGLVCSSTDCELAKKHEECDPLKDDTCTAGTCTFKPRRVIFVTSGKWPGGLGGVMGANKKCQQAASQAMLENSAAFKAWLSDDEGSPSTRFDTSYSGVYVGTDGNLVATDGWADLVDGVLLNPPATELGESPGGNPWTNTRFDGTSAKAGNCSDWTDSAGMLTGHYGYSGVTGESWTDSMKENSCDNLAPLYCVEDSM